MDKFICAKTIIKVQRYHERVIESLSHQISKKAISSCCYSPKNDTLSIANNILSLIERKKEITNLYIATKAALSAISSEYCAILIRFFYDDCSYVDISNEYNFSIRTAYRKVNDALLKFYDYLCENYKSHNEITKLIYGENLLYSTYRETKLNFEKVDPRCTQTKLCKFSLKTTVDFDTIDSNATKSTEKLKKVL